MKLLYVMLYLAGFAIAQPTITSTASIVRVGGTATITISIIGTSTTPTMPAVQFFLPRIAGVNYTATPGSALPLAKNLTCGVSPLPTPALYGCFLTGGITPLVDGVLATITFPAPPIGTYDLPISLQIGASAGADPVPVSAGPLLTLVVAPSPCDLNGDGKIDSADVLLATQNGIARLISASLDLTGDGIVNVVDVQRIINAANGGVCKVGP